MGVIGRREFKLIMSMDDQTKREREALNRGLGDIEQTTKKAAKESEAAIVQLAKESKRNMEGIKAVMELGGWLMMAQQVGKAFMDITAEARKNSQAFKEAGGALDVVKGKIGESLVKALEPLAKGFTEILRYGTAVFQNFPEIAKATFTFVGAIFAKTFSWEGIKTLFLSLGEGVLTVFKSAFEYIPKLFVEIIQLMLNPIFKLGEYISDTLGKAFTLRFKDIESPGSFMTKVITGQTEKLGEIVAGAKDYIATQAGNIKTAAGKIGELYAPDAAAYAQSLSQILAPSLAKFDQGVATSGSVTGDSGQIGDMSIQRGAGDAARDAGAAAFLSSFYRGLERAQIPEDEINAVINPFVEGMKDGISNVDWATVALNRRMTDATTRQTAEDAAFSQPEQIVGTAKTNPLGDIFTSLMNAAAPFVSMISSLAPVIQLLNPLQTIFQAMMEVLGPLITNLLAPLVGILKIVGYTIGKILAPALEFLRPIIEALALLFTWLYNNVIVPVANVIIMAFNWIYNGFADFINGILWLIDQIPFVDVGRVEKKDPLAGTLTPITTDTVGATGSSGGAGGSASYAAGTSITIEKIEIKADFIAGDAGLIDVAVMLRDKLLEAERAGR